jgi:hypothetical protein
MELFHFIVISIAAIILIVLLAYIGILMASNKSALVYPPISNSCPDKWKVDADGNCIIPQNGNNLGSYSASIANTTNTPGLISGSNLINPNDPAWSAGKGSICTKKGWANSYNIQWDGVTNYNSC